MEVCSLQVERLREKNRKREQESMTKADEESQGLKFQPAGGFQARSEELLAFSRHCKRVKKQQAPQVANKNVSNKVGETNRAEKSPMWAKGFWPEAPTTTRRAGQTTNIQLVAPESIVFESEILTPSWVRCIVKEE